MTYAVENFRCENTLQLRECTAKIFKETLTLPAHCEHAVKFLRVTTLYSFLKRYQ